MVIIASARGLSHTSISNYLLLTDRLRKLLLQGVAKTELVVALTTL